VAMIDDLLGQSSFMNQAMANQRAMFDRQSQLGMPYLSGIDYHPRSAAESRALPEVMFSEARALNRVVTIREELQSETNEWLKAVI